MAVSSLATVYLTSDIDRSKGVQLRSSHGLPPLSAFFVDRKQPLEEITNALKVRASSGQRVAVVAGMGGSGKTQVSLKYAYDNDEE